MSSQNDAPNVHRFFDTEEAYDASQCREDIRHGDVLVAADDGVIGFLDEAWPVALTAERGEFHGPGYAPGHEAKLLQFEPTYRLAEQVAAEMGLTLAVALPNRTETDKQES